MLLMAVLQVVTRQFGFGLYWGDELVRMAVLWVTMVGAVVAVGDGKHIRIDLVERFVSSNVQRYIHLVISLLTATVCLVFGIYSLDLIRWDYLDGTSGVGDIPAWVFETIIPVSAFLMALRFGFQAFRVPEK